ncbi:hypothetical protein [Nocardioides conyzicola]|uniref:LigA protein n=1 Tax=Nocardioides conyzicola TaxID=1651781 RepID=A0ABP8X288_9ACTN
MTDKPPATLDRLWDDIPTGSAPIKDVIAAGHVARRRKRRTALAGVATMTAVIVGGGFLATRGLPGTSGDEANRAIAADTGQPLVAHVETGVSEPVAAMFGDASFTDMAAWESDDQTLIYVSDMAYSSSCPPEASASVTDKGAFILKVRDDVGDGPCTADAGRVTVSVDGLTEPPSEVTLVAHGTIRTIPVRSTPVERDVYALECRTPDQFEQSTFEDWTGEQPRYATPQLAAASLLSDDESASAPDEVNTGKARVALLRADGTTRAVVTVAETDGAWRPDTISGCSGETLGHH